MISLLRVEIRLQVLDGLPCEMRVQQLRRDIRLLRVNHVSDVLEHEQRALHLLAEMV